MRAGLSGHRRSAVIGGALVVALALGGASVAVAAADGSRSATRPTTAPTAAPRVAAAAGVQDPVAASAAPDGGTPQRIIIPSIGVDVPLSVLTTDSTGKLLPPATASGAGWFGAGVVPGQVGPAIIAGHVDFSAGPGAFENLRRLTSGSLVEVQMSSGTTLEFQVTGSRQAAKVAFPTSDVYGTTPDPELRLITCAGSFDTSTARYLDNLIVFATEVTPAKEHR